MEAFPNVSFVTHRHDHILSLSVTRHRTYPTQSVVGQCLRTLTALSEDLGSISSVHRVARDCPELQSQADLTPSSGFHRQCMHMKDRQARQAVKQSDTQNENKSKKQDKHQQWEKKQQTKQKPPSTYQVLDS